MIALALIAALLAPPAIEMTNATSFMGARSGTWLYGPENLFDGKEDTAWCVGVAGYALEERVAILFDGPVRFDTIRVTPGDSRKFGSFWPANRPRVLSISNGSYVWQVVMPDSAEPFELPLPPPVTGRMLVIQIDESHTDEAKTTCLAGLTFLTKGEAPRLRPAAPKLGAGTLEGVWTLNTRKYPQVYLTFLRDGRMRAHQETTDDTPPPPRETGTWKRIAPDALTMTLNGKSERVRAHLSADPRTGRPVLTMDGRFGGEWTSFVPGLTFAVGED